MSSDAANASARSMRSVDARNATNLLCASAGWSRVLVMVAPRRFTMQQSYYAVIHIAIVEYVRETLPALGGGDAISPRD